MLREVVLDTETTGLELKDGHRIIEIGCVELIDRNRTGRFFHTYVNPERSIDSFAFAVHGISEEFVRNHKTFSLIAREFLDFIKDSRLVIHNADFDIRFINHELAPLGLPLIEKNNVIDTLLLARKKFPGSPASLDALCRRFNVSLKERDKHGALVDAELLAVVYVMMQKAVQARMVFDTHTKKYQSIAEDALLNNLELDFIQEQRRFVLSNSEKQNHEEMLKKIKNSIWEKINKNCTLKCNKA